MGVYSFFCFSVILFYFLIFWRKRICVFIFEIENNLGLNYLKWIVNILLVFYVGFIE